MAGWRRDRVLAALLLELACLGPVRTQATPAEPAHRIATTIDDLPWPSFEGLGEERLDARHQRPMAALDAAAVPATGVVNGDRLEAGGRVLHRRWLHRWAIGEGGAATSSPAARKRRRGCWRRQAWLQHSGRPRRPSAVTMRRHPPHGPHMPYTPIAATLGYVLSPDRRRVLMVHRNARPGDQHLGKYNGLGGKLEADEDVVAGMRREIREEAGIECEELQLRGTISWPGFGKHGEDWLGFLFVVTRWSGEPLDSNPEGTLEWVEVERILDLPLWEGDRQFLPLVFDDDPRAFHGVMPYRDGRMVSWRYSRI